MIKKTQKYKKKNGRSSLWGCCVFTVIVVEK